MLSAGLAKPYIVFYPTAVEDLVRADPCWLDCSDERPAVHDGQAGWLTDVGAAVFFQERLPA